MLPHFSYGPLVSSEIASTVIHELREKGFSCEWRLFDSVSNHTYTDKITTILSLCTDSSTQFNSFSSNMKRKIRKSSANGITIKVGKAEFIDTFFDIYSRNMHRLGSPALPLKWFKSLISMYRNGEALIWCAYLDNKAIGTAFMLSYQGFYEACWVSTVQKHNRLYTSYSLYWSMIEYVVEQKASNFSFGRSTCDSGVHKFKQQWGGIDIPLVWNYSHAQSRNIRTISFLPSLWRLIPYPIAKLIGPLISGRFY